jgi:phosphate/sulfate permease
MPHTTMLLLILAFVLYVMQPMMGVPMSSSIVFIGIVGCHNVAETIFTREVWKELRVFFGKVLWAVGGAVVAYAFFLFGKSLF